MNITIINQHTLNYGDDIAGISLIERIIDYFGKNTYINILYNTKGVLNYFKENIHHKDDVTLKRIGIVGILKIIIFAKLNIKLNLNSATKEFIQIIEDSDLIFVSPCGANIGIYKDWRFLIRLYLTVILGKKPIFHNNTIGKSNSIIFNSVAKYVLKNSKLYVRELKSYDYLQSIGLKSYRSVDTGFLFRNDKVFKVEKDYVLFIPTQLSNWHPDFKNLEIENKVIDTVLIPFLDYAETNNYDVYILPHLYGGQDEKELLEYYLEEIKQRTNFSHNIDIAEIIDCYDYDNFISHSKFVVSMRYHGVVMSIKNEVPFLSLAYENKMLEVCRYSNLDYLNIMIKDLIKNNPEVNIEEFKNKFHEGYKKSHILYLNNICLTCLNQEKFLKEG